MRSKLVDSSKKAVNLSVNSELIQQARAHNINLSAVLEQALAEIIKQKQSAAWVAQNKAAIESYNEHVESNGVFSDGARGF